MVTEKLHCWEKLGFFGGHVFLDFTNTVDDVEKTRKLDAIENWEVLLRWALAAKVITDPETTLLADSFSTKTTRPELDHLHKLRELAWRILSAIAENQVPGSDDLAALANEIRWAYAQTTLIPTSNGLIWDTHFQAPNPALIRARLGLAADNLLSNRPLKVLECGNCTGLFLNQGRGVGRKWCRMQSCGNRVKVNKFRTR